MGRPPKLTAHQKREALNALADGSASQADLARRFNVSQATISRLTAAIFAQATRSRPAGSSGLHNSSSSAYVTGERQAPLPNLRRALNASARQRTGYPQLVAAVVEPKCFIGSADQSARQRARLDPSALVGRLANWPAPSRQSASPRGRGRLRRRFGLTTHSTPLPRRSRRGSSPWAASRSFTPTARSQGREGRRTGRDHIVLKVLVSPIWQTAQK